MKTGAEYRASLRDGRATFFEGKRVIPILHQADLVANVTYQSIMTLLTAASRMPDCPEYVERIGAHVDHAQREDLRTVECITDTKGDRSLPPAKQHDPVLYVRVVDRSSDGVVIRGAKLHISGASDAHDLMTIPTKSMKAGEEAWAVAALVPVNAPGVKIVNTTYAPRHADARSFPISSRHHLPEGLVIFDDVFVPKERVFLDGEIRHAAVFARALGLWERLGGLAAFAEEADQLVGFAQLIAEANGLAGEPHIREKVSEMIIHATMIRAGLEAQFRTASSRRRAPRSRTSSTRTRPSTTAPRTTTRWCATSTTSRAAPW